MPQQISALQLYNLQHIISGDIPLTARRTAGIADWVDYYRMMNMGSTSLDRMNTAAENDQYRKLNSVRENLFAKSVWGNEQNDILYSLPGNMKAVRQGWMEQEHARNGLQQIDFMNSMLKDLGFKINNKWDQSPTDRENFWKVTADEALAGETYYRRVLAFYLYNAGCKIIAELTAALLNSNRGPLEAEDKTKIFNALYNMFESGELLQYEKESGAKGAFVSPSVVASQMRRDWDTLPKSERYHVGGSFELMDTNKMLNRALVDTGILNSVTSGTYKAKQSGTHYYVEDAEGNLISDPLRNRLQRKRSSYPEAAKIQKYSNALGIE